MSGGAGLGTVRLLWFLVGCARWLEILVPVPRVFQECPLGMSGLPQRSNVGGLGREREYYPSHRALL